jgi:hypothetical protein
VIPASSHRSHQSKYARLSKNIWLMTQSAPASTFAFRWSICTSRLGVAGWPSGKPATMTPKPRFGSDGDSLVEPLDELHQVDGVGEIVRAVVVRKLVGGRIAPHGEDIGDARIGVLLEDGLDLSIRPWPGAGEVGRGIELRFGLEPDDEGVGLLAECFPRRRRSRRRTTAPAIRTPGCLSNMVRQPASVFGGKNSKLKVMESRWSTSQNVHGRIVYRRGATGSIVRT